MERCPVWKGGVFAKGCEQGALRKPCQTRVDLPVNRVISQILLWRCKTSVFLNRERKTPNNPPASAYEESAAGAG